MPCPAARRVARRLGRRGAILTCYGSVWAVYGWAQLITPQPDQRGLGPALHVMPLVAWAWLWVVSGVIAAMAAWLPEGRDWPGFLSLPLIVLPWTVSYFMSWAVGDAPRGWVSSVVWAAIAAPVLVVAGWDEPTRHKRVGVVR
ncbi:hypothetical protein ACIP9H_40560 [Streptomyces sp. NPDC088732]|uniref:hypothetical protein n=1 Tax=Streptomyces sp. NPDC088732 TaxID=3365879 RepID=UPI00380D3A7A